MIVKYKKVVFSSPIQILLNQYSSILSSYNSDDILLIILQNLALGRVPHLLPN